jgi:predicted ArsR family transcriptional regulator
MNVYTYET